SITVPKKESRKQEAPPPEPKKQPPGRGTVLGRIDIPRVKISAVVREGVEDAILRRAVGHIPETALAGEGGNFALAAHRDTHFRGLRSIRKGDEINFVTDLGTYKYVVDKLMIVWPEHVEVLEATPDPVITLVTCYPFNYVGSAPKRFIVRARQTAVIPRGKKVADSAPETIPAGS
ncbi:MAG: class D sortase, partial [Bryobacteraceae bacterium]